MKYQLGQRFKFKVYDPRANQNYVATIIALHPPCNYTMSWTKNGERQVTENIWSDASLDNQMDTIDSPPILPDNLFSI